MMLKEDPFRRRVFHLPNASPNLSIAELSDPASSIPERTLWKFFDGECRWTHLGMHEYWNCCNFSTKSLMTKAINIMVFSTNAKCEKYSLESLFHCPFRWFLIVGTAACFWKIVSAGINFEAVRLPISKTLDVVLQTNIACPSRIYSLASIRSN